MLLFERISKGFKLRLARGRERKLLEVQVLLTRSMIALERQRQRTEERHGQLETIRLQISADARELAIKLEDAERARASCEETIEHLRQEVSVYKETTIPGLVEANRLLTERWNAQVSVEVRKQMLVNPDLREP